MGIKSLVKLLGTLGLLQISLGQCEWFMVKTSFRFKSESLIHRAFYSVLVFKESKRQHL